jgi:hypothetical protein
MRRALLLSLLFVLALVTIAGPLPEGASAAKDPRVAGLIKKVNALTKRVAVLRVREKALRKRERVLTAKWNCLGAQGVILRGTSPNEGYMYQASGGPTRLRSAFDLPAPGEPLFGSFATVRPSCLGASSAELNPDD